MKTYNGLCFVYENLNDKKGKFLRTERAKERFPYADDILPKKRRKWIDSSFLGITGGRKKLRGGLPDDTV